VTLDTLLTIDHPSTGIVDLIAAAAASKDLFVALVGNAAGALDVVRWGSQCGASARLSRDSRAQLALARAASLVQRGQRVHALGSLLEVMASDPVYAFRMFRKPVGMKHAEMTLGHVRRLALCFK
jgi:hypothetical protein